MNYIRTWNRYSLIVCVLLSLRWSWSISAMIVEMWLNLTCLELDMCIIHIFKYLSANINISLLENSIAPRLYLFKINIFQSVWNEIFDKVYYILLLEKLQVVYNCCTFFYLDNDNIYRAQIHALCLYKSNSDFMYLYCCNNSCS